MLLFFKNLLFTLLVPGVVAVAVPLRLTEHSINIFRWSALPGLLLLAIGAGFYCWSAWDFATVGRGTPAPIDAPKRLVIRGLYRYTRNPMYIGVLSMILGWALLFPDLNLLWYWFCVAACFQLFIVIYEEPKLRQLFGSEYEKYRSNVNRWIPIIRINSTT